MRLQCFMLLYVNKIPLNYVPVEVLDRLILEDGNYRLSRKYSNKVTTMRNIPEERRPHVHRSGSLKSRTVFYFKIISIHIFQYRLQYWFPSVAPYLLHHVNGLYLRHEQMILGISCLSIALRVHV